jgi:type IX secretion system PorP/SprF family membrane protein
LVGFRGSPVNLFATFDAKLPDYNMGVGLQVFNDQSNILQKAGFNGSYSYKVKIDDNQRLSFGISAGMIQHAINFSQVISDNPGDLLELNNYKPLTSFNIDGGLVYHYNAFELGVAAVNLANSKAFDERYNLPFRQNETYIVNLGYTHKFTNNWSNKSMFVFKSPKGLPVMWDVLTQFSYRDRVWMGLNYSNRSTLGMSVGLNYRNLRFGYAYDYSTTLLNTVSSGSHELMLGITLNFNETKK